MIVALFALFAAGYDVASTQSAKPALLSADQAAWKFAQLVEWGPAPYKTRFRALWKQDGLYLRFDSDDAKPWHTMTKRDEHLWDEEVVEIFLDLDGSGRNYAEYEINPANVICDVKMVRPTPDKLFDLQWNHEGLESRDVVSALVRLPLPLTGSSEVVLAAASRRRVEVQPLSHRASAWPGRSEKRRRVCSLVADRAGVVPRAFRVSGVPIR